MVCETALPAQAIRIPQNTNIGNRVGRRLGVTEIDIKWNAPGVKGREGLSVSLVSKITGLPIEEVQKIADELTAK